MRCWILCCFLLVLLPGQPEYPICSPFFGAVAAARSGGEEEEDYGNSIYVGGSGDWQYVYEPSLLPLPENAIMEHAHGLHIGGGGGDPGGSEPSTAAGTQKIFLTYVDVNDDSKCLLLWRHPWNESAVFLGPGRSLCAGVPHGLRAMHERGGDEDTVYLYHANNEQSLHKTNLHGDIVWTTRGKPDIDDDNENQSFAPTWFDAQPGSPFLYLADGYGSSRIYVYHRSNGTFTGHVLGTRGSDLGQFQTPHAITWDERLEQMIVSDRANHRLQYFNIDIRNPQVWDYTHQISFDPLLRQPCNIRFHQSTNFAFAIVPFLEGTVGILNETHHVVSVLNISDVLGDRFGFWHPHDAHFVNDQSGDFVLATWNPGRVGYFRRIIVPTTTATTTEEEEA